MSFPDVQLQVSRLDRVSQLVKEEGWSFETAQKLAIELNCDRRTIRRYWRKVRRFTQASLSISNVGVWKAQDVQDLSDIAREARADKDYGAAVKAIRTRAEIIGTIAPVKIDARHTHNVLAMPGIVEYPQLAVVIEAVSTPAITEGERAVPATSGDESDDAP